MGLKQSMKQTLGMAMTPQLQQAIKILQMSVMELRQEVTSAMIENPTLEEMDGDDEESSQATGSAENNEAVLDAPAKDPVAEMKEDFDWQAYLENSSQMTNQYPSTRGVGGDDLPTFDQTMTKIVTLSDHLLTQLRHMAADQEDYNIGEEIIGNLNEDGYLTILLEELVERLKVPQEKVEAMLKQIQNFDPPGVAARDLKECLLNQCEALGLGQMSRKILQSHLPELENKNYNAIAKAQNAPLEDVIKICKQIHKLEPKPGRSFLSPEAHYIIPDIFIAKRGEKFEVLLNEDDIPRLRVSRLYQAQMASKELTGEAKKYIKDKMKDAVWLLKSIDQRQKTIFRVTQAILQKQKEFFDNGPSQLRPMVLRDIADELGLHESTVSRVTTNKFVHTPHGIYELKYFFNSAISMSDGGEDMASESVKQKIKEIVDKENAKTPLSDQQIAKMLSDDKIKIARRTVAKYREALNILPSNKRKKFF